MKLIAYKIARHRDFGINLHLSVDTKQTRFVSTGPLSTTSIYYSLTNSNTYLKSRVSSLTDGGFNTFCNTLNLVYKLEKSSPKMLACLYVIYKSMHLVLTSDYYTYLAQSSKYFTVPEFVHCLLLKISQRVRSPNSGSSVTEGHIITSVAMRQILDQFRASVENDSFLTLIAGSMLFSYQSSYWLRNVKADLLLIIDSFIEYCDSHGEFELLSTILSDLTSVFYSNSCRFVTSQYTFTDSGFTSLGIFRFRNSFSLSYLTPLSSVKDLSQNSFELYCVVLKLFSPLFLNDGGEQLPTEKLAGDGYVDLSRLEDRVAWEFLFRLELALVPNNNAALPARGNREPRQNRNHDVPAPLRLMVNNNQVPIPAEAGAPVNGVRRFSTQVVCRGDPNSYRVLTYVVTVNRSAFSSKIVADSLSQLRIIE